jgi:hypothetical protein
MRIPTEHFAKIPVSTLSPLLSPKDEEREAYSLTSTKTTTTPQKSPNHTHLNTPQSQHKRKNSVGSAPTSPTLSRRSTDSDSGQRSISPGGVDFAEERDRFSPDSSSMSGPYSLPSLSMGLMAFKR